MQVAEKLMAFENLLEDEMMDFYRRKGCVIRRNIIEMIYEAGSGHPGGSLSAVELTVPLFFGVMKYDANNPKWEDRDRLVFSKGHVAPLLYALLSSAGYFPKKELKTLRKFKSMLQGHPDANKVPGVECSTGSLGQGLSMAAGMALAGKIDKKGYHVYALCGDGELQEGQIWEAAMFASHYKLDNLTIIVDNNGLQIDGKIEDVMNVNPIDEKFKAFGCHVIKINGHNIKEVIKAYGEAKSIIGKPVVIIGKTKKGRGVDFMEDESGWHGKAPSKEEATEAIKLIKVFGKDELLCKGNCDDCEDGF
jgi:transketolase